MSYYDVLKSSLENCSCQFVPADSSPRDLKFLINGEIEDTQDLTSWKLVQKGLIYELLIYAGSNLICVLKLDKTGIWKGRHRASNGTAALRPYPKKAQDGNIWLSLVDEVTFNRRYVQPEIEKAESFRYKELLHPQIDWSAYDYNLLDKLKKWDNSQIAIGVAACDRPQYFTKFIDSLNKNKLAHEFPLFVFLDKPLEPNNEQYVAAQIDVARKYFPKVTVIKRPRNFGCGRNIIDLRKQLFDNLGCEFVFVFEDDMVISENYLEYCIKLLEWSSKYSNVGIVQGWNHCTLSHSEKLKHKNVVASNITNLWGYLQTKKCWNSISPLVYEYQKLFLGANEYKHRPHKSILDWFYRKLRNRIVHEGNNPFPEDSIVLQQKEKFFEGPPTGQDAVTNVSMQAKGWVRIAPVVNRGLYIGKNGIHMSPTRWIQHEFDQITLEEFVEDYKFLIRNVDEQEQPQPTVASDTLLKNFKYINNQD